MDELRVGSHAGRENEIGKELIAMKLRGLLVALMSVGLVLSSCGLGGAAEPMREFLEGLRARQYYEWAMLYLEQLQETPNLPSDLKAIIPFERAMTLSESARHTISPETQQRQLDQALAFLEQFTKESPQHLLAATANSSRAKILLNKARVDILQAKLPTNKDNRQEFQDRAREQVKLARDVFQKAFDQYKTQWEAFPKFIDKVAEPDKFEVRQRAETAYMRAQLDVALCQFEEAQTYDADSPNRQFDLKKAVETFHEIHTRYSRTVMGLHAQMWEAKCYEELNDPRRAQGIYSQLLTNLPEDQKALQDQVRHFRLICLNHDQRREYAIVLAEADEWLKGAKQTEQRGQSGQGIRWELVVALERLADTSGTSISDRDKLLRQAIAHLTTLSKWPGPYRDLAQQRIRDLNLRIKGKDSSGDPKDFDSALTLARDLSKRVGEKKAVLDSAVQKKLARDQVDQLRADFTGLLKEQTRVLRLALTLADGTSVRADVNEVRYLLSYAYYLSDRPYEAAICAEAVAFNPTKDKQEEQQALNAAYLAVASYIRGFNQAPNELKSLRDVDMQLMVRVADHIAGKWPSNTKANETRMLVGRTFAQTDQPKIAAEWFLKVPETAENFPEAQFSAGQALWQQYLMSSLIDDVTIKPTPEELSQWRSDAEKFLKTGIERTQKKLPEQVKTPDELVAAKVALSEILLSAGQYQMALDLIEKSPHGVQTAIAVDDQFKRPPSPNIRSARFASHVYQLQLRGRVGLQQLDAAREVMAQLEQLAEHSGGADAVTAVYVQLGRELEKELNRLKGAGDSQRFDEVRKSFEQFLDGLFKREDQNLSSLTWIAETYYGLAQSSLDKDSESKTYFDRAASTYQSMIERAKSDKKFGNADRMAGIRLRLAHCKRRQGDVQAAESALKILLAERPRATDVQFEAVSVWHDQGLAGKTDYLKKALQGGALGEKAQVWGWTDLGMRLQRLVSDGRAESKDRYSEKLFEAWFNNATCRQKLGLAQSSTSKKQAELETAKQVIQTFVQITGEIPSDWWRKFDRLYRQIQSDLGQSPVALERPREIVIATATPKVRTSEADSKIEKPGSKDAKVNQKEVAAKPEPGGSVLMYALVGLIVVGGGGFSAWMIVSGQSQKKLRKTNLNQASPDFVSFAPDEGAGPIFEMPEMVAPKKSATGSKKSATSVKTSKPSGTDAARGKGSREA